MVDKIKVPVLVQKLKRKQNEKGVWHKHRRGQLFLINQGLIALQTQQGSQVISSRKAGWIPPHVLHYAAPLGVVDADSFYLDMTFGDMLPKKVCVFTPSALLREMIVRLSQWQKPKVWSADKLRLLQVVKDELKDIKQEPLSCPMPISESLQKQAQQFIVEPSLQMNLEQWANRAHMSKRTFTRHFNEETGMPFAKWCQQVRIMHAKKELANGCSVSELSLNLGYNSVSAFIKVFKEYVGQTPHQFQKRLALRS